MEISRKNGKLGATDHRSGRDLGKLPALENGPSKAAWSGPSRPHCKLKSMETIPEEPSPEVGSYATVPALARKDSSRLLDAYEIKMITKELYRYMELSRSKFHANFQARVCPDHGRTGSEQSQQSHNMNSSSEKHKKKRSKGFWIGPAAVCGMGGGDAVAPTARLRGHRSNHEGPASGYSSISQN